MRIVQLCGGFRNEHMEARAVFLVSSTPHKATASRAFEQAAASFHNLPSQLCELFVTRIRVWHHRCPTPGNLTTREFGVQNGEPILVTNHDKAVTGWRQAVLVPTWTGDGRYVVLLLFIQRRPRLPPLRPTSSGLDWTLFYQHPMPRTTRNQPTPPTPAPEQAFTCGPLDAWCKPRAGALCSSGWWTVMLKAVVERAFRPQCLRLLLF